MSFVDDEESERVLLQAILEYAGHKTCFAQDGEEALRQYAMKQIDVVVTERKMPEAHGFELITVLRDFAEPPDVVRSPRPPLLDAADRAPADRAS